MDAFSCRGHFEKNANCNYCANVFVNMRTRTNVYLMRNTHSWQALDEILINLCTGTHNLVPGDM